MSAFQQRGHGPHVALAAHRDGLFRPLEKIRGIPAAGGAAVGALVGGKKGALIGAGAAGGAGTAVVLSTRGEEVGIGRGVPLTLRLTAPVTVRVRR